MVWEEYIFMFKKGRYFYVGSAQKGVENRVERHLRKNKRNVKIKNVFTKTGSKEDECRTARFLNQHGEPIKNLG